MEGEEWLYASEAIISFEIGLLKNIERDIDITELDSHTLDLFIGASTEILELVDKRFGFTFKILCVKKEGNALNYYLQVSKDLLKENIELDEAVQMFAIDLHKMFVESKGNRYYLKKIKTFEFKCPLKRTNTVRKAQSLNGNNTKKPILSLKRSNTVITHFNH